MARFITLRNEITDPDAIDAVTGPGKFSIATDPVPRPPGLFSLLVDQDNGMIAVLRVMPAAKSRPHLAATSSLAK